MTTTREEFLDSLARYTLAITTPPYSGITEGNAVIAAFDAQAARIAELEAAGNDLVVDLKDALDALYDPSGIGVHPARKPSYDLDMAPVVKWRELVGGE